MAASTFYARIRIGNHTSKVSVQANNPQEAKRLIEAQYSGAKIIAGPSRTL